MVLFFVSAAEKDSEIKCPYKYKDAILVTTATDSSFCLKYDDNGGVDSGVL